MRFFPLVFVLALLNGLTACAHAPNSEKETKNYLEGDKKYLMAKICIHATHGGLRRMLEKFENEDVRTLVYECVEEGYKTFWPFHRGRVSNLPAQEHFETF